MFPYAFIVSEVLLFLGFCSSNFNQSFVEFVVRLFALSLYLCICVILHSSHHVHVSPSLITPYPFPSSIMLEMV